MNAISADPEPATRSDIDRVCLELRADIQALSADIQRMIHVQTQWIIGFAAATAAVTVAILRLT